MSNSAAIQRVQKIKEPQKLSERITWLRNYYFKGASRAWNNEFTAWTTGTPWDVVSGLQYLVLQNLKLIGEYRHHEFANSASAPSTARLKDDGFTIRAMVGF